jgi:hypothetical protein
MLLAKHVQDQTISFTCSLWDRVNAQRSRRLRPSCEAKPGFGSKGARARQFTQIRQPAVNPRVLKKNRICALSPAQKRGVAVPTDMPACPRTFSSSRILPGHECCEIQYAAASRSTMFSMALSALW